MNFHCHKADLIVEVDGDIHDLQQEEDARREKSVKELGLRVIRFRNEDVLKDLPYMLEPIREQLLAQN